MQGIISYKETPLKKVVENGITTISTDFRAMGKIIAQMILEGKKEQIENKCYLIQNYQTVCTFYDKIVSKNSHKEAAI